jgi:hypothetical protein
MVVIYHYVRNNINIFKALMAFSCVVIMAMVLGTIRDGYNVTDGDFSSGINLQEKILNSSNFTYGTKPIQLLLNLDGTYDYKLGQTYLTVFTNLIPRNLWESKPDPGGIIFTRDILGDPFGGFSYYSTGIFGEAFINFGLLVGIFFAVIQLFMLYLCNLLCILRLNKISDGIKFGKAISYYPFILFGIPAYLYAEFTTNTLSLMFFKITLFFIICKIVNFRMV